MAKTIRPTPAEKARLESLFHSKFPDKRLLALQLDGFSHRVIYDDVPRTPKAHAVDISFCMGQIEEIEHAKARGDDVRVVWRMREFLEEAGYSGHWQYQGNPTEVILVMPEDR